MLKKRLVLILCLLLLASCSNLSGKAYFHDKITMIEKQIDEGNWIAVRGQVDELKQLYDDQQWKLQLLGDEEEYEGLYESINRLIAAVKEEAGTEAKIELATIKSILHDIYTM